MTQGAAKRVCIVTDECVGPWRNGGIGTSMSGLAEALAAHGHDVTLLYTRGFMLSRRAIAAWRARYARHRIRFETLRPRDIARPAGPLATIDIVTPSAVLDFLAREQFDIVHVNDTNGDGFLAVAAHRFDLLLPQARFVTAIHSPRRWIAEFNRSSLNIPANVALDAAERISIAQADTVWAPSAYMIDWVRERGYAPPADVRIVQYLIPTSDFLSEPGDAAAEQPTRSGGAVDAPVTSIVFFGRLEKRKGLDLFLDAIDALRDELAARKIEIILLGRRAQLDGVESGAAITRRAKTWRFPWRILDDLGQREALNFLRQPGRFAIMASPADNSPCTVYEALEFRLCFLAAATGGIPELIHADDRDRALFPFDGGALAARLREVLASGAAPARPAQTHEERLARWLAFHDEMEPPPAPPTSRAPMDIVIDVGRDAEALKATLASLASLPDAVRLFVIADPHMRPDSITDDRIEWHAVSAARDALEKIAAAGRAGLFLHAGVALASEAFDLLAGAIGRDGIGGLAPSASTPDGQRADALGASVAMAFLQGPAPTGLAVLSAAALRRTLATPCADDAGPFAGLLDAALVAGVALTPFPRAVARIAANALRSFAPKPTQGRLDLYARADADTRASIALLATHAAGHERRRNFVRRLGFVAYRSPLGPIIPEIAGAATSVICFFRRLRRRFTA